MLGFLKPTMAALEKLESGVEMCCDERGNFTMKGAMLAYVCDLPARAMLMTFAQYNGAYSFPCCLQPGKSADNWKGHTHVFEYQPKRSRESECISKSFCSGSS